jgi:hypothetical protein
MAGLPAAGAQNEAPYPDPETSALKDDIFADDYFGLALPLPTGWSTGPLTMSPAPPGRYRLGALEGPAADRTHLEITAQDLFFGDQKFNNAAEMAESVRHRMVKTPALDFLGPPLAVTLGNTEFVRIDYIDGALYHTWLATDVRCHVVVFDVAGPSHASAAKAVQALKRLSLGASAAPVCRKNYATRGTVTPTAALDTAKAPLEAGKIPVRMTLGTDGRVRHVHLVPGAAAPSDDVVAALMRWRFVPYRVDGKPVEVETGVMVGATLPPAGN